MIRVKYVPQINDYHTLTHTINGEVIRFLIDGVVDVYDFTGVPDGILEVGIGAEINPIISAKRTNGVLEVEILKFITKDSTYIERFPTWIEV